MTDGPRRMTDGPRPVPDGPDRAARRGSARGVDAAAPPGPGAPGRAERALGPAGALARRLLAEIADATADAPGITRIAYGDGERRAHAIVAAAAMALGCERTHDAAGNQFLTFPGTDRDRRILVGSHLDSVPHGGDYDGTVGVVLGVALQAAFHAASRRPPFDLTVACLRAEESCWFPHSYIGSKTALGRLDPSVLDEVKRSDTARTLAEHIRAAGFDPDAVRNHARWLDPARVVAYLEPHIEQAPALLAADRPLAVVTGIRGSFRHRDIVVRGEYAHSGAMPRALRRDAVVAGADLVRAMHALWIDEEAAGADLTVTFGQIGTDPARHSFSTVPGECRLCLDVRSESVETLARVHARLAGLAAEIGARHRVTIDLGPRTGSEPALMHAGVGALLDAAFAEAGVPLHRMASGAGHDAATFAQAGVPSAMLFLRNANGSHNPDESLDLADLDAAIAVLWALVDRPAADWAAAAASGGRAAPAAGRPPVSSAGGSR